MNWTVGDFAEALAASVAARPGIGALDPVPAVLDYYPGDRQGINDGVFFGFMADDNPEKPFVDSAAQRREETNDLACFLRVQRAGAGAAVNAAARDRALFLIGEVDDQLRHDPPAVGSQTIAAAIVSRHLELFPIESARVATIEFVIRYRART